MTGKIRNITGKIIYFAIYILMVVISRILDVPCVWRKFFGINCPGCGTTRAYIELMHLNLNKAFQYNYMFWSVPVIVMYILFDGKPIKNRAVNDTLLIIIGIGFAVLFILRLFGVMVV